jgi:hypothetical protein
LIRYANKRTRSVSGEGSREIFTALDVSRPRVTLRVRDKFIKGANRLLQLEVKMLPLWLFIAILGGEKTLFRPIYT